jgi:hypothetical protein
LEAEHVKLMAFSNCSSCEELQSGIVLTHSNPGWQDMRAPVIRETVERLPCLLDPPESWKLLYGSYPEKVFLLEPTRDDLR